MPVLSLHCGGFGSPWWCQTFAFGGRGAVGLSGGGAAVGRSPWEVSVLSWLVPKALCSKERARSCLGMGLL